jgi:hypothetical protein
MNQYCPIENDLQTSMSETSFPPLLLREERDLIVLCCTYATGEWALLTPPPGETTRCHLIGRLAFFESQWEQFEEFRSGSMVRVK